MTDTPKIDQSEDHVIDEESEELMKLNKRELIERIAALEAAAATATLTGGTITQNAKGEVIKD